MLLILLLGILAGTVDLQACSIIYYVDPSTGKIYVANNEDYWYDTKAYIQIEPGSGSEYARLWYGWDRFAQGGVNAQGLFFDAAVTPEQEIPEGLTIPMDEMWGMKSSPFAGTWKRRSTTWRRRILPSPQVI